MIDDILTIFADEQESIPYRKMVRKVTGSINSAILLQQMCYNWHRSSRDGVFYKFKEPCGNDWYNVEDSWIEELGFTRGEYDGAIKHIGTRAESRKEILELLQKTETKYCVVYYTDRNNITWFYYNKRAVRKVVEASAKLSRERAKRIADSRGSNLEEPVSKEDLAMINSLYSTSYHETEYLDSRNSNFVSPHITENTTNTNTISREIFEVKEAKALKPKIPKQSRFDKRYKDGINMPSDFEISSETLETAVKVGYNGRDVSDERIKFLDYYKNGKGKTSRHWDWNSNFLYGWLDRNYKKGYLKRDGEFYTTSANQDRLEKLRKHSQKGLFAGFTD